MTDLIRDQNDIWYDDTPGKFDIKICTVAGYNATARLLFICPNAKRCGLLLAPNPIPRVSEDKLYVWGWNGNLNKPTITPSINCIAEKDGKPTGGCGWHGFITNGIMC